MKRTRSLSAIEASFVGLERAGLPMHVCGLVVFGGGGPVTVAELQRHAARRLGRLPRFHDRLLAGFAGGRPRWEPVARLDVKTHVFHHRLHAGARFAGLRALAARIHAEPLDRSRPLWELHLVDGLPGGRQALIVKTHHAITDGIAGVEIAETLFDPAPGVSPPRLRSLGYAGRAGDRGLGWAALEALLGLSFTVAGGPVAPSGPFNAHVGPRRAFGTAALPMEELRAIKRRTGGSVDDVLLALVAAGLGRYLAEVGYPSVPKALRAMLPVSTRPRERAFRLGNHVSSVFVDLPVAGEELPRLVRTIAASKATLRTAHAVAGSSLMVEAAGLLPSPLHRALLRVVWDLPVAHLVLSDVPGPDEAMHLLGRRIEAIYPMLPLAGGTGLSIATLSMGGVMGVGVTADPAIVPDAQRIATAIEKALVDESRAPVAHPAHRRAA